MRVILEKGDKPEVKELVRQSVMPFFSVRSQWVAVYRILVDYYGFPEEVAAFCNRISKLIRGTEVYFTIDYQSVQKPLAANGILQKPYSQWQVFCAKKGDRSEWHLAEALQPVAGVLCQEG